MWGHPLLCFSYYPLICLASVLLQSALYSTCGCGPYLSVTMIADGWAHAVMKVTMKRNTKKGMSVLQERLHFPDTA